MTNINIQALQNSISELLINPLLWKFTGFSSSIVGFICYALSPSFHHLFGRWTLPKIVVYSVIASLSSIFMLFVKRCCWGQHGRSVLLKAHVGFVVLTLTTLWSFLEDRSESEEGMKVENRLGKMMNLTSSGAFALMATSLSRQLQVGFEVGVSNFLVGCFLVTLMKMSFKLAPLAAFFCYLLVNVRSISDFLLEMRTQHTDDDALEADFLRLEAISDVFEDEAGYFQGLEPYSDVLGFRSSALHFQTAWDLA